MGNMKRKEIRRLQELAGIEHVAWYRKIRPVKWAKDFWEGIQILWCLAVVLTMAAFGKRVK